MKKASLSLIYFLGISFVLSALQGNLYFLPISVPSFWFIVLTYYSFKKSLTFSLSANIIHCLILTSFTTLSLSFLLIVLNLITLVFSTIKERFNINNYHIVLASGAGQLSFLIITWLGQNMLLPFSSPEILSWLGTTFMTMVFTPPLIYLLNLLDQRIHFERVDTLENLRI